MPDDPGGSVVLRSSLAFETRLPRGHRVQGIVWMDPIFLVSLQLGDSFLWRARPELPLKGSLRTNQWSPADASSHKFRSARRDAAPATSDARQRSSLASWLTSIFTCAPGVRGPIARQSAVREIIRGRVGTAVTAERTAGASAGEPSRRRRVSGERDPHYAIAAT